ncbi:MAG: endo,4-beta-xylanase [Solirubrobacterales bacterium]|nr:endo,4-beta-xylanase [Solirubrobacterales bacterium]
MRRRTVLSLALVALAVGGAPAAAAVAAAPIPPLPAGFIGVNADGPLLDDPSVNVDTELGRMRTTGLTQLRAVFDWAAAQPTGPDSTDFSKLDTLVGAAAKRGLAVLPVVIHSPAWAADQAAGTDPYAAPPKDPGTYAAFLTTLIRRYGPAGSLWAEHPELPRTPIRRWQIWNEPNIVRFWSRQPFAKTYTALLKAADVAVGAADPGARVVLGGITNGLNSPAWDALSQLYKAGAGGHFDVIAVHPYTGTAAHVIETLRRVRAAARQHNGAKTPIALTELSWSSGGGKRKGVTWDTTEAGQARMLTLVFQQIAKYRVSLRITSAYWYTWLSPQPNPANGWEFFAGLNRMQGGKVTAKPALAALRLSIRRLSAR